MSKVEKTQGLLLRRHDFSENSFVVGLFTRDFGTIRAIAKGAKRERSPMHGALEPLTLADVVFYRKRTPALHILSQARTAEFYRGLRGDLKAFYAAHHVAALLLASLPDELPHPELFERAVLTLRRLDEGGKPEGVVFAFEAGLLKEMGSFPRTDACAECGKPWSRGEAAVFHPLSGGALHERCASGKAEDGLRVRTGTLQVLRQFGDGKVPTSGKVTLARATANEMRAMLDAYFRFLLEREIRTRRFI